MSHGSGSGDAVVAVDFTHPDAVMDNIEWSVPRGINMVIGTTGFNTTRSEERR